MRILGIEGLDTSVTIGNNLQSNKLGSKGIIKVAEVEFSEDELNRDSYHSTLGYCEHNP